MDHRVSNTFRPWSVLAQVMACGLKRPSHYLKQWWLEIIDIHLDAIWEIMRTMWWHKLSYELSFNILMHLTGNNEMMFWSMLYPWSKFVLQNCRLCPEFHKRRINIFSSSSLVTEHAFTKSLRIKARSKNIPETVSMSIQQLWAVLKSLQYTNTMQPFVIMTVIYTYSGNTVSLYTLFSFHGH